MSIKNALRFTDDQHYLNWKRNKDDREATVDIAYGINRIADSFERIADAVERLAGMEQLVNCPNCNVAVRAGECRHCHRINR